MPMDIADLATRFDSYHASVQAGAAETARIAEQLDALETRFNRPGFAAGAGDARGDLLVERKALNVFARTGDETALKQFQNSISVGDDTAGGYLVMPALSTTMTKKLFDQTPMRRLARVETITSGSAWMEPVDFDDIGAVWASEKQSRPATDTPTVKMLNVPCDEIYALQPVTQRAIDDVGQDLGAWLEGKITDRFARTEGAATVTGNGIGKPKGFLTYDVTSDKDNVRPWGTMQYVPSGATTYVTADALRDLVWSVRAPYRTGAVFLMNSNTASSIDKLKDGDGNYVLRPGMTAGAPSSMLGYPIEFSEDMPDMAAGSLSIAFGNFKLGYVIVEKAGIRFLRDPFSDKPNVQFYAYRRVGGGVANSEAVKLMRTGTT